MKNKLFYTILFISSLSFFSCEYSKKNKKKNNGVEYDSTENPGVDQLQIESERELYKKGMKAVSRNDTILYSEVINKYVLSRFPLQGVGIAVVMMRKNNFNVTEDDAERLISIHCPGISEKKQVRSPKSLD